MQQMSELTWWLKLIAGLVLVGFTLCLGLCWGIRQRINEIRRWQDEQTPPLERLRAEQRARDARSRLREARRPHRSGSPGAPN